MTNSFPTEPIMILDEFELRPRMLEQFLRAVDTQYRPGAEERGLRLLHTWVTPPVEVDAVSVSVLLVWQLAGVAGFWEMRSQNSSPEVAAWWSECERFVVSRTRRYAVEAEAMAGFAAAGRLHA